MKKHPLGSMLKFSSRLLEKSVNDKMNDFNITRSQMDLLAYVFVRNKEGQEVNQVDIEKYLNLKNPTVSGLINRLEKKDYIKRDVSSKGANFKSIVITQKGIELIDEAKQVVDNVEKEMFIALSVDEKIELERLLQKIIDYQILNEPGNTY